MPNHLAGATSPYLLQHADNPVDWWPWGDEAFAAAARRDVPVFVSIGYASCHWCHVMAHESFEDPQVAERLNRGFVAVKVDREEHPAVDAAYIRAAVALTGQAGWPLSVFTTPDGRPFYTGTYYPARPVGGIPAFTQVLDAVATAWAAQRADVLASAGRIAAHLTASAPAATPQTPAAGAPVEPPTTGFPTTGLPTPAHLDAALERLTGEYDAVHGGFGGAPKFPPSTVLGFLARHHARTGDPRALDMLTGTCRAMAAGGIHDQLRGGFARYSVDAGWVVPHFEKMLYDNALLAWDYLAWWRLTGHPLAERVVRATATFLLTDLRTPQGGFAASLDADTVLPGPDGPRRVEGASYVWTRGELVDVLGASDAGWAADLLGVTTEGTVGRGASTLRLTRDLDGPGADPTEVRRWEAVRDRLRARRATRPAPARDDKVVTAWNALAVAALTDAGTALGEPAYVQAAADAADLLLRVHLTPEPDGVLRRTSRDGVPGPSAGLLEDYASLVGALAGLAGATGDARWARAGGQVADRLIDRFTVTDPAGHGLTLADVAPRDADPHLAAIDPPGRPGGFDEQATPSGRALSAWALARLAAHTGGGQRYRQVAQAALTGVVDLLPEAARFVGGALGATEALLASGAGAPE